MGLIKGDIVGLDFSLCGPNRDSKPQTKSTLKFKACMSAIVDWGVRGAPVLIETPMWTVGRACLVCVALKKDKLAEICSG